MIRKSLCWIHVCNPLTQHNSIMNFAEHDVSIPITVPGGAWNQFKKGNDTKEFWAREFIRLSDSFMRPHDSHTGPPLIMVKLKGNRSLNESRINPVLIAKTKIFGEEKNESQNLETQL